MTEPVIDENLYSRQIYVLGVDAMKKLAASSVLISGMGGLGVEIAKNVILAGVKNVTIHDRKNCQLSDLASNFYLKESSIGQNRALACLSSLTSLNDYVTVCAKTDELTDSFLKNYNCIVITDYHKESEIQRIAEFCHQNGIKLILTETRGVFGYVFDDFGEEFVVNDPTGEQPTRFLISMITNSENGVVTIDEDAQHGLGEGDYVRFEEVEGMTELNGKEFPVKVIDCRHFSIGDTRNFGKYTCVHRSGYGNQVIKPLVMKFQPLKEAVKNPENIQIFDFCAFGRDQQVILAFLASQRHMEKSNLDTPEVSAEDLLQCAKEINDEVKLVEEIDEKLLTEFARESTAVISPTCATFGGIAGQEVLKAVSGKFTPLKQFMGVGYVESLPKEIKYVPQNDRYDPYRLVFGNEQQEVMQNLRYFMIGAGALGCEQLKNWALMGVATKGNGKVFLTDMDNIERSNLNRQFLFRNSDIGKMKSDAAATAVLAMNNELRIEPQQNRIGPETAAIYNDDFYEALSGVCNALDNVQTRLYSDQQCVFYRKPLLESGTLGPKAHYQIIMPDMTESYGSQPDPPEKGIPMCTLHNFPSCIDHTCMWARDVFGGLFEQQPQSVNSLLTDPNYIDKMRNAEPATLIATLEAAKEMFITNKCENFDDCIKWARNKFEELFNYKIRDLQNQFPEDAVTKEGLPFWTGSKRYPTPSEFDPNNQYHSEFVIAASIIRARIYGIQPDANVNIPERAAQFEVAPWKPSSAKIVLDDDNNEQKEPELPSNVDEIDTLVNEIKPILGQNLKLYPEEFEKDDDSNGHMDFIAAAANIRAINYQITPIDKLEIKRIAGKIIPAIATTTAMICGLVALEMYKVHSLDKKPIEEFRFGSINLAIDMFSLSEPIKCQEFTCAANGIKYTLWDKWVIEGDLTLQQFIDAVKEKYSLIVDMISVGRGLLYASFDTKKAQERLNRKISEILVSDFNQEPLKEGQKFIRIDAACIDENDVDVETPPFLLRVK
ncbi:Ubiquitin-like modifier-activating enzyme 1 [Histomonas meleagridis]|uniref:Ubiquitin-like modifier-activating enzyme 1 n=1 Tax=Histomonas meleagridis TaxID=135588 RepID=UPI003559FBC1|nr:Ubiquitin-like modifier-activating enzyme 1 [Histomonas meleagridis]KAH0798076.1 Ubiquitin-like modifier-activating enzyme 1 [Histomonas meleagridis]